MELGFFTRTKTGVIQSRLQNDVGGVSDVLTNTITSILGNTVTVISALVAMVLIDWRLTIIAVILMPALVLVQRRVGQVRARIAAGGDWAGLVPAAVADYIRAAGLYATAPAAPRAG
jgi:ATP-binding cassette subfamily B protein